MTLEQHTRLLTKSYRKPKAILTGAAFVSASILAQLGYGIFRDITAAELQAAAFRNAQMQAAWKEASKGIENELISRWREKDVGSGGSRSSKAASDAVTEGIRAVEILWLKVYEKADVTWMDGGHVVVSGIIETIEHTPHPGSSKDCFSEPPIAPETDCKHAYSWKRTLELLDDGQWYPSAPEFHPIPYLPYHFRRLRTGIRPGEARIVQ